MGACALRAKDIMKPWIQTRPLVLISVGDFLFNMLVTSYLI